MRARAQARGAQAATRSRTLRWLRWFLVVHIFVSVPRGQMYLYMSLTPFFDFLHTERPVPVTQPVELRLSPQPSSFAPGAFVMTGPEHVRAPPPQPVVLPPPPLHNSASTGSGFPYSRSTNMPSQRNGNNTIDAFVVGSGDDPEVAGAPKTAHAEPFDPNEHDDKPWFLSKRSLVGLAIVLTLTVAIAVAVPVAISLSRGGGGSSGSDDPTSGGDGDGQNLPAGCLNTTRKLADAQLERKGFAFVDYTLCPKTTYNIDDKVNRNEPFVGQSPPLLAQSNMRVKCGADGLLTDACIVSDGEVLVRNAHATSNEYGAFNVTFEGITFENGWPTLMEMTNGGDIVFKNCLFRQKVRFQSPAQPICGARATSSLGSPKRNFLFAPLSAARYLP